MKKFNGLDVFIVIIIFLAVGAVVFYLNGAGNSLMASDAKTVYFTVEVTYCMPGFADNIKIGDKISDSTKGDYYGTVSNVEVKPTTTITSDLTDGTINRMDIPDRYNVYVTVMCDGRETDSAIYANGQKVTIGKLATIKGKGYAGQGYITELRTEDKS